MRIEGINNLENVLTLLAQVSSSNVDASEVWAGNRSGSARNFQKSPQGVFVPGEEVWAGNRSGSASNLRGTLVREAPQTSGGAQRQSGVNHRGLDLYQIVKGLQVSQNKLLILRLLKRGDLLQILLLLSKDQLINGLRFFSKSKLLRLMMLLPKQVLLKMLLHLLPLEHLMQKMPTRELMSILRSRKLNVRELVKGFKTMDPKHLHFILGKITGLNVKHLSMREMMAVFMKLKKRHIMQGMRFLPFKALTPFVTGFAQKDPSLLQNVSLSFIFKQFDKMSKPTMLESFRTLDNKTLIKFLSNLPDKFLIQVAAQIDDSQLEKFLVSQQPELLALLAGDMAA